MNDPKQGHPACWKFAHPDRRFRVGLVLICAAMFICLMTGDLSLRPRHPPPQAQSGGVGIGGNSPQGLPYRA
jgi:hypothetical protein